jgi:hypothetical protein
MIVEIRRKHYNFDLEIISGIHKSGPDIYIGFSPDLHLQCGVNLRYEYTKGKPRDIA